MTELLKDWQSYQWAIFTALHVGMKSHDSAILEHVGDGASKKANVLAVASQGSKDSWGTILQGVEVAHVFAALDRLTRHQKAMAHYLYGARHTDKQESLLLNYGWYGAHQHGVYNPDPFDWGQARYEAIGGEDPRELHTYRESGGFEHAAKYLIAVQLGLTSYRRAAVGQTRPSHTDNATAMGMSRAAYYKHDWNECLDTLYDVYEELNGSTLRSVAQYFNDIRNREAR